MAQPRIFVSYSHADTKPKERLLKHLTPLDNAVEFDVCSRTLNGSAQRLPNDHGEILATCGCARPATPVAG